MTRRAPAMPAPQSSPQARPRQAPGGLVARALAGPGAPLPAELQREMGPRLGFDFAQVRVHADEPARQAADAVQARAFTLGRHIVLGAPWQAGSAAERGALLRHEMVHASQSPPAAATAGFQVGPVASALEREAHHLAAPARTGRPQRAPAGLLLREPLLLGPALGGGKPIAQGAAVGVRESLALGYQNIKQKAYRGAIRGMHDARRATIEGARELARSSLEGDTLDVTLSVIGALDVVLEFLIQIPLYVLGMAAGFGEGIYALVEGLIAFVLGLLKWFGLWLTMYVDNGVAYRRYTNDILQGIRAIPQGLKQVWNDWTVRFDKASPDETTILIGELIGQVLAIIASFGLVAAKAGQVPKLAVSTSGLGVMRGAVAAEGVVIDFASQSKTVAALAEIGANSARIGDAESSGAGPKPDPQPAPEKKPSRQATPEEQHAASPEAALGLSAQQVKGLRDLLGKPLSQAPTDLGGQWGRATNAAELKIVKANTNMSKPARDLIRSYFDKQRTRFWRAALKKGSPTAEHFKSLGFKWGEPGTAPYLELQGGKKIAIDIDHITEIRQATGTALDAENLRLTPARENRTVLRLLHDKDPFQKVP